MMLAVAVILAIWLTVATGWIGSVSEFVSHNSPLLVVMDAAQRVVSLMGYPGLVLIIFLENVFPPIPSDVVLPLAGYTAATTSMTLFGAILATTVGSLLGAVALYYAGHWLGEPRVRRLAGRFGKYLAFEEAEIDRSLSWFRRHGSIVVMLARLVPVFRSLISIPAGMSGMPLGRFLAFSAVGAGTWNTALILAGFLLGSNWELVVSWLDQYQFAMLSVNTGLVLVFAGYRLRMHRRRQQLAQAELE